MWSKYGRLADGSMRFVVKLPAALADRFVEEMQREDRKKLPMARYIIQEYFRIMDGQALAEHEPAASPAPAQAATL